MYDLKACKLRRHVPDRWGIRCHYIGNVSRSYQ